VYDHLLAPGRIGSLEIPNRIVMSPMGSNLAESDGHMGERIIRYYEERARGGVGLLIVGVGAIAFPAGACNPNQVAISHDTFLPGLSELTERVHAQGSRVAIQLQHAGKVAVRDMADGRPMWVPSEIPFKTGDLTADLTAEELQLFVADFTKPGAKMLQHVMDERDIARLIELFTDAAGRAKRAGFDGVELHAGHGYILSSFLSPTTNLRDDQYGGPIENRARLLVEVIQSIKRRLGEDFPLWCRLDAKEFSTPGGISEADGQRAAELAADAGADAIHVSAYADATSGAAFTVAPLVHAPGGYIELAAAIKKRVEVPVIAVGRIEPEVGDRLIGEGRADFVAMARKLLADPALPNKLKAGRPEDVRPCIYCYTCVGQIFLNQSSRCAVNPASGREAEFEIEPAEEGRQVLVLGGGPAGMEAARVAALRGHRVTLCEKSKRLGGTARFSSLVYPVNGQLVDWLETQIRKLPIELVLGREATPEWVRAQAPDVVVVALGARREISAVSGAERATVFSGDDLRALLTGGDSNHALNKLRPWQRGMLLLGRLSGLTDRIALTRRISRFWMPLGRRVVVVGGGLVGIELAEFLAERGRRVRVLEPGPDLAPEMSPPRRWRALHEVRALGVDLRTGVKDLYIDDDAVRFSDAAGEPQRVSADSVILAIGTRDNPELADAIEASGIETHRIGDCRGVRYIEGAMLDAARIAREI